MDTLMEYTKDIEEMIFKIANEKDDAKREFLQAQLDFTMQLFVLEMDYKQGRA